MGPRQNVSETAPGLWPERDTSGAGGTKQPGGAIFSWDNAGFTEQSQRPWLKLSIEWVTRNGIILGVWGILKNTCGLGGEDSSSIPCLLHKSKVCSLASKGEGESVCLDESDVSGSQIPYLEMLTLPMRFPWCSKVGLHDSQVLSHQMPDWPRAYWPPWMDS